eukprot:TRINITY_DN17652_c0_g1_i4.p1 TRINITY_DN17652_c0_g1~~TRINITY_DN17652_c0_g1_i4.p1  ORF type:complete len:104 (+),score=29.57 TRINITY_DN17652_c0_g1_i4:64-375(+)
MCIRDRAKAQAQDEGVGANKETESLSNQIAKLKKIKKQSAYWCNIYGDDLRGFNPNYLYDVIKAKKKDNNPGQYSSPSKKKVEGGSTTKEITLTEGTRKKTTH